MTFGLACVAAGLVTRDPDQREFDIVRSRNGAEKLVLMFAGKSLSTSDWLNFLTRSVIGHFCSQQSRNTPQG